MIADIACVTATLPERKIVESIYGAVSNHVIYLILLTQNADYLC